MRKVGYVSFNHVDAAGVEVDQSVQCPFKGPSKRCISLTDAGSNPGRGVRW